MGNKHSALLPIKFAVKPYVKKYLLFNLPGLKADRTTTYGKYFLNMLGKGRKSHDNYEMKEDFCEEMVVYISDWDFKRYASRIDVTIENNCVIGILGPSFTMDYNDYVSKSIKKQFEAQVAAYLFFDPSLKRAIDFGRMYFGIKEEEYSNDAIRKAVQRARTQNFNIPKIYKSLAQVSDLK